MSNTNVLYLYIMWGCACITEIKTKLSTVAVTLVHNSRHNGVGSELKVEARLIIRNLDKQKKRKKGYIYV